MLFWTLAIVQWALVAVEVLALALTGFSSPFVWACFFIVLMAAVFNTTLAVLDG